MFVTSSMNCALRLMTWTTWGLCFAIWPYLLTGGIGAQPASCETPSAADVEEVVRAIFPTHSTEKYTHLIKWTESIFVEYSTGFGNIELDINSFVEELNEAADISIYVVPTPKGRVRIKLASREEISKELGELRRATDGGDVANLEWLSLTEQSRPVCLFERLATVEYQVATSSSLTLADIMIDVLAPRDWQRSCVEDGLLYALGFNVESPTEAGDTSPVAKLWKREAAFAALRAVYTESLRAGTERSTAEAEIRQLVASQTEQNGSCINEGNGDADGARE